MLMKPFNKYSATLKSTEESELVNKLIVRLASVEESSKRLFGLVKYPENLTSVETALL